VFFTDIGNVFAQVRDVSLGDLRQSVGSVCAFGPPGCCCAATTASSSIPGPANSAGSSTSASDRPSSETRDCAACPQVCSGADRVATTLQISAP
jgi:hypothetical protein